VAAERERHAHVARLGARLERATGDRHPLKPGIVVLGAIPEPVASEIHALQQRFDPRLAAELPPHITIAGSSGMGPIPPEVTDEQLATALEPIAERTAPIELRFEAPIRFMATELIVLPLNPHGPLRALHERIKTARLPFEPPRFAFTPHCTLNFYRELSDRDRRALLAARVSTPWTLTTIECWRAASITRSECVLRLALTGPSAP
jgi:2'-5' RNA ligase